MNQERYSAILAAAGFSELIDRARTQTDLATIKDGLDEAIGAFLAQERRLVTKRELLPSDTALWENR